MIATAVRHIQPAKASSGRFFVRSFAVLTGNRWDSLFHERDLYGFVRSPQRPLVRLGNRLTMMQTGFAAGKSAQSKAADGVIQIRPTNLGEDHELIFTRNVYIDRREAVGNPLDLLQRGEVLFNNTNSQALVGKTVLFDLPGEFVASNHITRLRTDSKRLRADFLVCLLNLYHQRGVFYRLCTNWNNQSGVGPEVLGRILIPDLNLDRQEKIASEWNEALARRKQDEQKAQQLLASIDELLLAELGINLPPAPPATLANRIFTRRFSALTGTRWDPLFFHHDIYDFIRSPKLKLRPLRNFVRAMNTGFAAGKNDQADDDTGIVQIRPTNLSDDRELIFDRNVHIDRRELAERPHDVLQRREVLFNNTNSQELVGKSVFFDLPGEFFASNHITRVALRETEVLPEFLTHLLNLYQRKRVFFRLCTNWNNQSGVSPDVLGRVLIPEISVTIQQRIAGKIAAKRDEAKALRAAATTQLAAAKQEIEAMILRSKSP